MRSTRRAVPAKGSRHRFPDRLDTPGHHLRALRRLSRGSTELAEVRGGRGMRFAFRRGLDRRMIARALAGSDGGGGRPVALLLPTGTVRWHWIVACGRIPGWVLVSAGDGKARPVSWDALEGARLRHAASRVLGIDGLGYVAGPVDSKGPLPFPTDRALERDLLRLAAIAEEGLAFPGLHGERVLASRAIERLLAKIGWKRAAWSDILRVGEAARSSGYHPDNDGRRPGSEGAAASPWRSPDRAGRP